MVAVVERCALCGKRLRKPEAQERGVGRVCEKRLTPEALQELRKIIKEGMAAQFTAAGIIQITIE